jgi:hypothetical protein
MRQKALLAGITFAVAVAGACSAGDSHGTADRKGSAGSNAARKTDAATNTATPNGAKQPDGHGHEVASSASDVPAFVTDTAALKSLPPTLAPEKFTGKQRLGYQAAAAIPRTIAQLPCYCHCDKGFGHKSLHSCFVDDHAAHCAVCLDEALLAYQLEKEQKLKPDQIREYIIGQYAAK